MKLSELITRLKEQGNLRVYCCTDKMHYYIVDYWYLSDTTIKLDLSIVDTDRFDYLVNNMFPYIIEKHICDPHIVFGKEVGNFFSDVLFRAL
jgi:hypothetical protein